MDNTEKLYQDLYNFLESKVKGAKFTGLEVVNAVEWFYANVLVGAIKNTGVEPQVELITQLVSLTTDTILSMHPKPEEN